MKANSIDISEISDAIREIVPQKYYVECRLNHLLKYGIDSQNIMNILKDSNLTSEQIVGLHKLLFTCEGLVKNKSFERLEEMRIDMVCEEYR